MGKNETLSVVDAMKMTSIITAEGLTGYGDIARLGIEEFVSGNVIILRNLPEAGKRRRTIDILKFRGAIHQKGERPFTVVPREGITVIPLSDIELKQKSSSLRIHTGTVMHHSPNEVERIGNLF